MDETEAAIAVHEHFVDATYVIPMKYGTFDKMPGNFETLRARLAQRSVFTRPGFKLVNSYEELLGKWYDLTQD